MRPRSAFALAHAVAHFTGAYARTDLPHGEDALIPGEAAAVFADE